MIQVITDRLSYPGNFQITLRFTASCCIQEPSDLISRLNDPGKTKTSVWTDYTLGRSHRTYKKRPKRLMKSSLHGSSDHHHSNGSP